jgi:hypothetical protein
MSDELPPRPQVRSRPSASSDQPPAGPAPGTGQGAAPGAATPGADGERSSANRRALGLAVLAVLVLVVVASLVGGSTPPGGATFPPAGATTGAAGGASAVTRGEIARALAVAGLQVEDATRAYRPAEAPAFATAPRIVVRAILPDDPDHGLLVIYEFIDQSAATAAAEAQAAYVASGVGRVQFPNETQFVIRVLGSTAVFYAWSPPVTTDQRAAAIATALETLGVGVPVPG